MPQKMMNQIYMGIKVLVINLFSSIIRYFLVLMMNVFSINYGNLIEILLN